MTTLDRDGRLAVGVALAALVGIGFLAIVFGIPAASMAAGTGMMGGGMMGGPGFFAFVLFVLLAVTTLLALGYAGIDAITAENEEESTVESEDASDHASDDATDPIARLQRRYIDDELTEAEFERAIERELAGEADEDTVERPAAVRETSERDR